MIISKNKEDYIEVDDFWLKCNPNVIERKVHLVKIDFAEPTIEKLEYLMDVLPKTNRFIVSDNIKFYNDFFRNTRKKYYVENTLKDNNNLISFLRRNNKVLINFNKVDNYTKTFLLDCLLEDILRNVEIIKISTYLFNIYHPQFENWSGNVVVTD